MIDATVLFAGTVWPRWSYAILDHAVKSDFDLVLSPLVIQQARTNLDRKFPGSVGRFDVWLSVCRFELVPDPSQSERDAHVGLVRQVEDIPIALASIRAGVDYFVTDDKDFTDKSASTQEVHRQLTIMRPVIFLREVMGWSSEELEKIHHRNWPVDKEGASSD